MVATNPYIVNVVSNFISLLALVLVSFVFYIATERRALLKFFRVSGKKRINLYLSNLSVRRGGAIGVDGQARSFAETAIPFAEAYFIGQFQRLFNRLVPGLEGQPGLLRWLLIADVEVNPQVSPLSQDSIDKTATAICLGSPGYNQVSKWAEDELNAIGRFTDNNAALSIKGLLPFDDTRCGFVQRVVSSGGVACFYAAGPATLGTIGAAYFLVSRWKYLRKYFGDNESFCVVMRVDASNFRNHTILLERRAR